MRTIILKHGNDTNKQQEIYKLIKNIIINGGVRTNWSTQSFARIIFIVVPL